MEITIRGNNYRVGEAMEEFATRKLARLNRFLPNIAVIHVDLTQERSRRGEDRAIAQITVRHARGAIIRAEESASGTNMESALTQALDNMYRRIERFKSKRNRKGRTRFSISMEELAEAEANPEIAELEAVDEDEEDVVISVVRRKTVSLVAMNEQEAIEQMELLGHSFFMFFNDATGSVNVVYQRRSGGYGVLIPAIE